MFLFLIIFGVQNCIRFFKLSIWYVIWYMLGICLVYKKWQRKMTVTENVKSNLSYSDICKVYTIKKLFLLYHQYVQYQRLWEITIFDCYTLFIFYQFVYSNPFFAVTLTHIANGMQIILTNDISKQPQQTFHYLSQLLFVASLDPINYVSNKRQPLLLIGPLPL